MKDSGARGAGRGGLWAALAAGALLAVFAALAATSAWDRSCVFDEGFYISGGYGYLKTGDPTMAGWFHPVGAPLLAGAPLVGMKLTDPRGVPGWREEMMIYGPSFMNGNTAGAQTMVRASRTPFVAVGVILGLGVFWWSARMFGLAGGIVSLMLLAVEPNLIAHAGLATTDLLLAATVFGATACFLEHLRRPRWATAIGAGALAGAAMLTKTSALLMFPGWVALGLIYMVKPARAEAGGFFSHRGTEDTERSQKPRQTTEETATTERHGVGKQVRGEAETEGQRWGGRRYERFGWRLGILAGSALVMAVLAAVTIGAAYRFDYARTEATTAKTAIATSEEHPFHAWTLRTMEKMKGWTPLPTAYLKTTGVFLDKARTGHPGYLNGEVGGPWWYYYPETLALKTPIGLMALATLAVILLPWSARPRWGLELMVVPAAFMAGCMTSSVDTGLRHVLPVMPFAIVLAGSVATVRMARVRVVHGIAAVLVAWAALATITRYPDYLAYFNEIAGGPEGGGRYLGDSNLDWGQDVGKLGTFVKAEGIKEPVRVFLHTQTPTEKLGFAAVDGFEQRKPEAGWYALGATVRQGIYEDARSRKRYEWLLKFEPVTTIGHTIRVYHISEGDVREQINGQ